MKTISLVLLSILLFSCNGSRADNGKKHYRPNNDVTREMLNGNVRSVTEMTYRIDETGKKRPFGSRSIIKFNSKGNTIEAIFYDQDSSISSKHVCKYDSLGKLIEQNRYGKGDSLKGKVVMKYNNSGKCIGADQIHNGALKDKSIYVYDDSGNLIIDSLFNTHDTLVEVRTSKYDNYHHELENDVLNVQRNAHMVVTSKYDDAGNIIENSFFFKNRFSNKSIMKYEMIDKAGNWLI
ncbi:MAG: hypothetical protein ACHQD8_04335 [Chitinophagales bacterium]